jgi:hypothetical protein
MVTTPQDLPANVILYKDKCGLAPNGQPREVRVDEMLLPVLVALAQKNPTLQFKHERHKVYPMSEERASVMDFSVHDTNTPSTKVGEISITTRYSNRGGSERVFTVGSPRLASERERGHEYRTKDAKNAIKTADKYFKPPPLKARVVAQEQKGARAIREHFDALKGRVSTRRNECFNQMIKFAAANKDAFMATLDTHEQGVFTSLLEVTDSYNIHRLLRSQADKGDLLTVIIEDDKYVLYYKQTIYVKSSDELPEDLRVSVGMLKLMEVSEMVEGKGVRTAPNCFVVSPTDGFKEMICTAPSVDTTTR